MSCSKRDKALSSPSSASSEEPSPVVVPRRRAFRHMLLPVVAAIIPSLVIIVIEQRQTRLLQLPLGQGKPLTQSCIGRCKLVNISAGTSGVWRRVNCVALLKIAEQQVDTSERIAGSGISTVTHVRAPVGRRMRGSTHCGRVWRRPASTGRVIKRPAAV